MRFDEHSFLDEITNKAEAHNCYRYLTQNMGEVHQELAQKGTSYENTEAFFQTVWKNLLGSCDRVGYTNAHLEEVRKALSN